MNQIRCDICPHNCALKPGQTGICGVRTNIDGQLHVPENLSAIAVDPIEKKPLYHFFPGKKILSIGGYGCNLHCKFCQNYNISQEVPSSPNPGAHHTPDEIVRMAQQTPNNIGVAYTYNEPTVFYEFMLETAELVHRVGMRNVMVSNGFINQKPLENLLPHIDAFNIDLKAFSDEFYKKLTGARLQPVLQTLKTIKQASRHLEVTFLVIPGLNDDETQAQQMFQWIATNLGPDTPLHISRYFPMYKLQVPATPIKTLNTLQAIALKYLKYCYLGNVR